jgi:predicted nucleic acid-binding protein
VILADASAWIEFDRLTGSPAHVRLRDLLVAGYELATTEPVIMEVLAGARTDRRATELSGLLARAHLQPLESTADFHTAAKIYRQCRKAGITPRGLIDCMIAAVALRTGAELLAHDADLARIARVIGVRMDSASLVA